MEACRMRMLLAIVLWLSACGGAVAADWPQWGGTPGRNMMAGEKGLPESFVPGERDAQGRVDPASSTNVKWVSKLGTQTCSTPTVSGGRVFVGYAEGGKGHFVCMDEATGRTLWRWSAPPREVPAVVDGRKFWFGVFPRSLGVCSTATVDGDRVYIVTHRLEVLCLDARGQARQSPSTRPATDEREPKVLWMLDMWALGVRPSDACNCSVVIHGDVIYVCTSNGVDRDADARKKDEFRKAPAQLAPSLIALEKTTGRLLAMDDAKIGTRLLHGQWSSPSVGEVNGKTLVFLGGGDGVCYAFEALAGVPEKPVTLKTAWSFDCNPPEYKQFGDLDLITHYCLGDRRRTDALNKKEDGLFVGMSEIIATPVFHDGRVYVAIGRDPEHGRGRGALWCIDASKTGDITQSGRVWCYQGLDRSMSTVSILDGLVYVCDVAGRVHCVDAKTGAPCWVLETKAKIWGSTLAADGKVYVPTDKFVWVLAAGREMKVIEKIRPGAPVWTTPVAANGVLYVASTRHLWAAQAKPAAGR